MTGRRAGSAWAAEAQNCRPLDPSLETGSMAVSLADVDHVAHLARLGLDEAEREGLRKDLEAILGYVEKLAQVDTAEVEPTASVVSFTARLRDDAVTCAERPEEMVASAPDRDGTFFRVPTILEV